MRHGSLWVLGKKGPVLWRERAGRGAEKSLRQLMRSRFASRTPYRTLPSGQSQLVHQARRRKMIIRLPQFQARKTLQQRLDRASAIPHSGAQETPGGAQLVLKSGLHRDAAAA